VGINTSEIPPMPQDDYAVELWVKAGAQTADAQLLQLGEVGLVINDEGKLCLESNNVQCSMVNGQFFCIFANETLKNNEYEEISVHFRPFLPVGNGTNHPGTDGAAV
jgi:hypothetical protein